MFASCAMLHVASRLRLPSGEEEEAGLLESTAEEHGILVLLVANVQRACVILLSSEVAQKDKRLLAVVILLPAPIIVAERWARPADSRSLTSGARRLWEIEQGGLACDRASREAMRSCRIGAPTQETCRYEKWGKAERASVNASV
eukprot:6181598-Pleurochrysis_carterae.AAC.2